MSELAVDDHPIVLSMPPYRNVAAALLVTEDGRYLMQLRDDLPGVSARGHWGLFGGGIEAGETPFAALQRELEEELGIVGAKGRLYTRSVQSHPTGDPTGSPVIMLYNFFEVPITAEEEPGFVQREGAGRALFTLEALLRLEKLAPWDLYAVMSHARHKMLFRADRYAW